MRISRIKNKLLHLKKIQANRGNSVENGEGKDNAMVFLPNSLFLTESANFYTFQSLFTLLT